MKEMMTVPLFAPKVTADSPQTHHVSQNPCLTHNGKPAASSGTAKT
jgi:hypothetical protein